MERPTQNSERAVHLLPLCSVAATAVGLDQITKWIAAQALLPGEPLTVVPGILALWLRPNPFGAFGLFAGFPEALRLPVLLALAVIAMLAVTHTSLRLLGWTRLVAISLGLVLGGAVANLADRVFRGEVIDFIHLHLGERFHWPTFNLADLAITSGSLLLAISLFRMRKHKAEAEASPLS